MAHADADDVSIRLMRELTTAEALAVEEWLTDVEVEVLDRYPDILASGDERRLRALMRVECAVAIRALRNPDPSVRQRSRTRAFDDYSETDAETIDTSSAGSAAGLSLTADEWAQLAPAEVAAEPDGAFSITPRYSPTPSWGAYR